MCRVFNVCFILWFGELAYRICISQTPRLIKMADGIVQGLPLGFMYTGDLDIFCFCNHQSHFSFTTGL